MRFGFNFDQALAPLIFLGLGLFLSTTPVCASPSDTPTSLIRAALFESTPSAFAPSDISAEDFSWSWTSKDQTHSQPPANIHVQISPQSLQWVRVSEVLVIPRARLIITAPVTAVSGGHIDYLGVTYPFMAAGQQKLYIDLPIVLLQSANHSVRFSLKIRDGKKLQYQLKINYQPKQSELRNLVMVDSSCSSYQVDGEINQSKQPSWAYVGCRLIHGEGAGYRPAHLEMHMILSEPNLGNSLIINQSEVEATQEGLWVVRTKGPNSKITVESPSLKLNLTHSAPSTVKYGFFGVGLGPYQYTQHSPGTDISSVIPLLTIYMSYFLTETVSLAAFNATNIHKQFLTDTGIYLRTETNRILDRRVSLSLMLGAHAIAFKWDGKTTTRFSAPQGVEALFRDFLKTSYNLSAGAFIYPPIASRSYYNLWLRWGKASYFAEFNYIGLQEPLEFGQRYYSRSVGLSFGFPLFRFL